MKQESLSPAEKKVCAAAQRGLIDKEIAVLLGISYQTVRNHMSAIYRKLGLYGLGSRYQLLLMRKVN